MARVNPYRRLIVVAAYVVIFWVVLPLALVALGLRLDTAFGLTRQPIAWGWPLLVSGLALVAWAALWLRIRGHGLPVSALPPPRLVVSGPYRLMRHPIYLGYNVALVGLALVLGSPGLLFIGGPFFLLCWIVYALIEERDLRRRFGAEYQSYQAEVAIWPRPPLYQLVQVLVAARALPVAVEGRANLPRGPYIVVANHACYLDPVFLSRLTWRPIRFLATAESFRSRLFGWALRRAGAIPLRRYTRDSASIHAMLRHLAYGEIIGIFVEGERAPLGVYQGALPRAAALIAQLGVPAIPVGICGSYDAGPRWSGVLRRRPVTLRIGAPVAFAGRDPVQALDAAIGALLDESVPRVHLAGLSRQRLGRVLWACPRCFSEDQWDVVALRCVACGAHFAPTADGLFVDQDEHTQTLATLGACLAQAAPIAPEITCAVRAFHEHSSTGPIRPLDPLGAGTLRITHTALAFTPWASEAHTAVSIPLPQIRSASTERADTLQIATASEMWQFRPERMSVFRLRRIVATWARPRLDRPAPTALTRAP